MHYVEMEERKEPAELLRGERTEKRERRKRETRHEREGKAYTESHD
jgi:hypothetical protein